MIRITIVPALATLLVLMTVPARSDGIFDAKTYGAKGTGTADDTKAIQRAIDACALSGGGEVVLKGGTFSSGAVFIKGNVTFHIDGTAVLKAKSDGIFPSIRGRWEGNEATYAAPLVTAIDANNITLKGTGKIVGGTRAVLLKNCKNVKFQDLNITCNVKWTNHLLYCEDVLCERLTIRTTGANTDGLVIDSSRRIKVRNCTFSTGDDCIPIKSGKCLEGVKIGRPSSDIDIRDCVMEKGFGGIVIGSEMSGGVENVVIENIRIGGTGKGAFRLKTNKTRGGYVRNILLSNIQVTDGSPTVSIEPFYVINPCSDPAGVPVISNVRAQAIKGSAGSIACNIYSMSRDYKLVVEKCTAITGAQSEPFVRREVQHRPISLLQDLRKAPMVLIRQDNEQFTITGVRIGMVGR